MIKKTRQTNLTTRPSTVPTCQDRLDIKSHAANWRPIDPQHTPIGHLPVFGLFLLTSTGLTVTSIVTLARAPRPLSRTNALRAFEYHLIDKAVLPGAFIALATGPLPALLLTAAGVLLTWPAVRTLLYRYELGQPRPA